MSGEEKERHSLFSINAKSKTALAEQKLYT